MEHPRLLSCLADDFTRLRHVVASADLTARVPNCPEWTVDDLAEHVAVVYLHKVECMRQGKAPEPWPPDRGGEPALALLDRGYAALTAEFAARRPEDATYTWYEPRQTVGFWIRRMAQETVVHRVDAEQAAAPGQVLGEIPDDLAIDGIDEVLECFLGFSARGWADEFPPGLLTADAPDVLVRAGDAAWLVRTTPEGVWIDPAGPDTAAPASVSGAPAAVLLWLWRRADEGITRAGDPAAIERLRALMREVTQ